MSTLKKKFVKLSDKILKQQVKENNINPCVCSKCKKESNNTKLYITGKTFDELYEDMCSKFDIYSEKSVSPEIKKSMETYFKELQTKNMKPIYLCESCHNKK